ncbi:transposase [Cohnella sp. GCM10012308]|uniref:transposase n=1 Tax=Cohnella sp. GCM10012308 TaxID=3317329 RepID=UPI0036200D1E
MPNRFSIQDYVPAYNEEDCAGALFAAKWPDGFRCPRCAHPHFYMVTSRGRHLFECRSCAHQTSLTAGTVLEGTRTPLSKWFQAMFLMQLGISAKLLAKLISVTYKTAWLINHKLRHAIGEWDRGRPLAGDLQLLGEYYGYEYHRYFSSQFVQGELRPQPVVVGVSLDDTGDVAHVKMKAVDGPEGDSAIRGGTGGEESVECFVQNHVAGGEATGHAELLQRGHHGRSRAHHAWREAVRWLARTFGGIGPKHLQAYLNEFCFRRICRNEVLTELITSCGMTKTITYRRLVGARSGVRPIKWVFRPPARHQQRTG